MANHLMSSKYRIRFRPSVVECRKTLQLNYLRLALLMFRDVIGSENWVIFKGFACVPSTAFRDTQRRLCVIRDTQKLRTAN